MCDNLFLCCSGDCGMFALKYVEHVVLNESFDTLQSENMRMFRKKWCVDLFYNHLIP
ncbi:MAG: hypothetical protein EOP33_07880 [Rickettsiaceae bacterium]|nr:MAG: hypothetical protein EOP33_07880 [Rickettsiaceae bacterium]